MKDGAGAAALALKRRDDILQRTKTDELEEAVDSEGLADIHANADTFRLVALSMLTNRWSQQSNAQRALGAAKVS